MALGGVRAGGDGRVARGHPRGNGMASRALERGDWAARSDRSHHRGQPHRGDLRKLPARAAGRLERRSPRHSLPDDVHAVPAIDFHDPDRVSLAVRQSGARRSSLRSVWRTRHHERLGAGDGLDPGVSGPGWRSALAGRPDLSGHRSGPGRVDGSPPLVDCGGVGRVGARIDEPHPDLSS